MLNTKFLLTIPENLIFQYLAIIAKKGLGAMIWSESDHSNLGHISI